MHFPWLAKMHASSFTFGDHEVICNILLVDFLDALLWLYKHHQHRDNHQFQDSGIRWCWYWQYTLLKNPPCRLWKYDMVDPIQTLNFLTEMKFWLNWAIYLTTPSCVNLSSYNISKWSCIPSLSKKMLCVVVYGYLPLL